MKQQKKIISLFGVRPTINPEFEIRSIVEFLKLYLKKNPQFFTLVLGISGGQDSTLTGKISQIAINELKAENRKISYKFIAIRLPYGDQKDEDDCKDVIDFIQPDSVLTINIKDAIEVSQRSLRKAGIILSDFLKGNEKARERMKVQYSIAGLTSGLVVGAAHAAEAVVGFFTKYGDGGTDINPIFRLNKRQGRALLKYLNCPEHLYLKIPTADLEEDRPYLPDELALGVTYDMIDDYLEGKIINSNEAKIIEKLYYRTNHKLQTPVAYINDLYKIDIID